MTNDRASAATTDRWFAPAPAAPGAEALLVCLPHAGGSARAFAGWRAALAPRVAVLPLALPGRDARIIEPPAFTVAEVADAVAARADRPYALYGHSMGARVAFEVVRTLRERGAPLPVRLYVGGSRPPDRVDPLVQIAHRPDEEFVAGVTALGGVPAGVLDEPELREMLLPVLRADFGWLAAYRYRTGEPLDVPVVAVAGAVDPTLRPEAMAGWARHTTGGFALHVLPGGHFLPQSDRAALTALLADDLAAAVAGRPPAPAHDVPAHDVPAHGVPAPATAADGATP